MTTVTVAAPSWEALDERLLTLQGEVRWGTLAAQGKALVAVLAELRGDLAVLRHHAAHSGDDAGVAQRTEHRVSTPTVASSSLAPRTTPPAASALPSGHGYTGNFCAHCQSALMVRAGNCELCQECGETTGCS